MYKYPSCKARVVSGELSVTYSVERVKYVNSSGSNAFWYKLTRRASKSYSFEDLTESAALLAAETRIEKYTRPYYQLAARGSSETYPKPIAVTACTTSVTPRRVEGKVWRCSIEVRETDVRASPYAPVDPAEWFSVENARDYDTSDDEVEIEITNAEYSSSTGFCHINLEHNLTQEQRGALVLKCKTLGVWNTIPASSVSWNDDRTLATVFGISNGNTLKFVLGVYESNECVVGIAPEESVTARYAYTGEGMFYHIFFTPTPFTSTGIHVLLDGIDFTDRATFSENQGEFECFVELTQQPETYCYRTARVVMPRGAYSEVNIRVE